MRRNASRGETALREADDARYLEQRSRHRRRRRDCLVDAGAIARTNVRALACLRRELIEGLLDLNHDARHGLDGRNGILADRRLCREHDRVRPIEDRICDVGCLGASRSRTLDHRLQHLRGRDDRSGSGVRERNQSLLRKRNLFEGQLHAKIAARHHHHIAGLHDSGKVAHGRGLLDLRYDVHVGWN